MELKQTFFFFGLYRNTRGFPPSAWRTIPKHTPSKQQEFSKSLCSFTGSNAKGAYWGAVLPHLNVKVSSGRAILRSRGLLPLLRASLEVRGKESFHARRKLAWGHFLQPLRPRRLSEPTVSSRGNWELEGWTDREGGGDRKGSRDGSGHQGRPQKESELQDRSWTEFLTSLSLISLL